MFERSEMGQSDRLWSLIVIPCSWFAVAAAQVGIAGAVEWPLLVAVVAIVVSLVPQFVIFVTIWSGRVDRSVAEMIARPMAVGLVLPVFFVGFLDAYAVAFVGVQVFGAAIAQLAGVLIRRRTLVYDSFATVVGSATGIAGFWLGWWNDVSPIGISVLFFVYGFGVSTAAFTWIETSSTDLAVSSE